MKRNKTFLALLSSLLSTVVYAGESVDMVSLGKLSIDKTEVTIGQFSEFVLETGYETKAEREGGGLVFAGGWEQKEGWNWRSPYGVPAFDDEPAVHITFDEAVAYCRWAGKRLPTEVEWISVAYTEQRDEPTGSFVKNRTYPYPTGNSPAGANCLNECGPSKAIDYSSYLNRGIGHARVGTTRVGINGLYDMGSNVWEWVDIEDENSKGIRGGSWWYGRAQMQADYKATKPRDMAVVYIGFRCARDVS